MTVPKPLRIAGYVTAYLFAFVIFAYTCFPYERLKDHLVSTYNASQRGAQPNRLEIDDLTWSWRFPGLVMEGVRLVIPEPPSQDGEETAGPGVRYLEVQDIAVTTSILALLSGHKEAHFVANALLGSLSGYYSESEEGQAVELNLDSINPGRIPQLVSAVGLPIDGQLSGTVELLIPEGKIAQAEGNIQMKAEGLELGDGKAKIQNIMALPTLRIDSFALAAEVAQGRLKIKECTAQGGDLELTLTGGLRLRQQLENSIANLELNFRFADKYRTKDDKTRAIFGAPDSKVPGLFDTVTKSMLSKQDDGSYSTRLTGSFDRLTPRPLRGRRASGSNAAGRRRASRSRRAKAASASDDAAPADE